MSMCIAVKKTLKQADFLSFPKIIRIKTYSKEHPKMVYIKSTAMLTLLQPLEKVRAAPDTST